jgi:hypothetical protein
VGGEISTDIPVQTLAGLPGFGVDGGKLTYVGGVAGGGSITALLGKVTSGALVVTEAVLSPDKITAITIPGNKTLSVTTSADAVSGAGPQSLSIPKGLFLTTPGLTNVSNVTVQGGGRLIFSGVPGSLSLAAGSVFTLNEDGWFDGGQGGLVLGTGAGSQTIITGPWSGNATATTITGAAAGGTISGGAILGGTETSVITIGTFSAINLFANTTIDIPAGTIVLAGTASGQGGAKINFAGPSSVISGTEGLAFAAGSIAHLIGTEGTGIIYGTLSGQAKFASIRGLSATGGSILAGSTGFTGGAYTVDINTSTAVN